MKFEIGLISEFAKCMEQNWKIFLAAILLNTALIFFNEITDTKNQSFAGLALSAMVALYAHKSAISAMCPGITVNFNPRMIFSYALRLAILVVITVILTIISSELIGNPRSGTGFLLVISVMALIYSSLLSLVGTMLPAIVTDFDSSFSAAFRRAKKTFLYNFLRLFFGIGSLVLFFLIASIFLANYFQIGEIIDENGRVSFSSGLMSFSASIVSVSLTVLASVILSRALLLSNNFEGTPNG